VLQLGRLAGHRRSVLCACRGQAAVAHSDVVTCRCQSSLPLTLFYFTPGCSAPPAFSELEAVYFPGRDEETLPVYLLPTRATHYLAHTQPTGLPLSEPSHCCKCHSRGSFGSRGGGADGYSGVRLGAPHPLPGLARPDLHCCSTAWGLQQPPPCCPTAICPP
jgi:hypothetical protein